MPTGERTDPFRGYNFRIEIDSVNRNGFRECSGLDATQEPVEYREGTDQPFTNRKLPGLVKYSNIVLKWGVTDDASLFQWRKDVIDGKPNTRKNGSIVLMNEAGEEKMRWNFVKGWPSKWTGPSLNATSNDVAIETLEIAHEGVMKA